MNIEYALGENNRSWNGFIAESIERYCDELMRRRGTISGMNECASALGMGKPNRHYSVFKRVLSPKLKHSPPYVGEENLLWRS